MRLSSDAQPTSSPTWRLITTPATLPSDPLAALFPCNPPSDPPLPTKAFHFLFASPSLFSSETWWIKGHFGRERRKNHSSPLPLTAGLSMGIYTANSNKEEFCFHSNYFSIIVVICGVKRRLWSPISSLMAMLSEFHHLPSSP